MFARGVTYIAARYLFSRKSHSIVNIISVLSALAVAVPTAAMIVLLSVYNGMDDVLRSMYGHFDPQIKISASQGRYFDATEGLIDTLRSTDGVEVVSQIADENVFVTYGDRSAIVTMRGVDSLYDRLVPIGSMMAAGEYSPSLGDLDRAVVGAGIAYNLGVNIAVRRKIEVFTYDGSAASLLPMSFYRSEALQPVGVYQLDAETDGRYMLVPLRFARGLLARDGKVTALGLRLADDADEQAVQKSLRAMLGDRFKIQNRFEQKETVYRIMAYEKIGIFFIILMVIAVSSLTLVASVVMLVADKEPQLFTLGSMGATVCYMRDIFFVQGVFISSAGVAAGLLLGLALAFVQQRFGLIAIGGGSLIIDTYPVRVAAGDVVLTLLSVSGLDIAISYLTSRSVIRVKR